MHAVPLAVLIPAALPSLFCVALVLPLVVASTAATSSLHPLVSASLFVFAQSFCCTITFLLQSPNMLLIQVDQL